MANYNQNLTPIGLHHFYTLLELFIYIHRGSRRLPHTKNLGGKNQTLHCAIMGYTPLSINFNYSV